MHRIMQSNAKSRQVIISQTTMKFCQSGAPTKRAKSWIWRPEETYSNLTFANQAVRLPQCCSVMYNELQLYYSKDSSGGTIQCCSYSIFLKAAEGCLWGRVGSRWEDRTHLQEVPWAPSCMGVTLLPFWTKKLQHIQEKRSIFRMSRCILVHVLRTTCKPEDTLLLF